MDYPLTLEEITLLLYQKVPMRDGVHLAANIYLPQVINRPLAAIMILTPYSSDISVERGTYFARHGFAYVTVESRGRGNSEGLFIPFINEGEDGHDAVEWIARQPWCSGRVGLMGGSYLGMVQWLIAKEEPPHLVSMAPTATVCPGIDATRDKNIFRTFNLQVLSIVSGRTFNPNLPFSDYIKGKIRHYYLSGKAYADLLKGNLGDDDHPMRDVFEEWLAHPTLDDFWTDILPGPDDYARMNLPILSITGHFDDDQPGHMHYYREFQKHASAEAKSKMFFVIGPWDHGGTRRPAPALGGLEFGETAVVDMLDWHRQWFDWTMKDGDKPAFLTDNVLHYHMGVEEWRDSHSLAEIPNREQVFYLSSEQQNPTDPFHSGKLRLEPADDTQPHILQYDPLKPADKDPHITANNWSDFLVNRDYLQEPGWLYYHSPPFEADLDVTGHITLNAYFEIDTRDTDFFFKLYEFKPDGSNIFVAHGLMRARYRKSLLQEQLVTPGSINKYEIESLYLLSRCIKQGSRLRLLVGYLDSSAYQKNYNSGGDVSFETAANARTCTIRLHCSEKYPSSLQLPVTTH